MKIPSSTFKNSHLPRVFKYLCFSYRQEFAAKPGTDRYVHLLSSPSAPLSYKPSLSPSY